MHSSSTHPSRHTFRHVHPGRDAKMMAHRDSTSTVVLLLVNTHFCHCRMAHALYSASRSFMLFSQASTTFICIIDRLLPFFTPASGRPLEHVQLATDMLLMELSALYFTSPALAPFGSNDDCTSSNSQQHRFSCHCTINVHRRRRHHLY
jgi:hypothetical protein